MSAKEQKVIVLAFFGEIHSAVTCRYLNYIAVAIFSNTAPQPFATKPLTPPHYFISRKSSLSCVDLFSLLIVDIRFIVQEKSNIQICFLVNTCCGVIDKRISGHFVLGGCLPADCYLHFLPDELQIFFSGHIKHFGTT